MFQKQSPGVAQKNFTKFTGKHLYQSPFLSKVTGCGPNFIKEESLVQVFSCEFGKIFMSTFFIEPLWWLQQFAAAQQTSTTKLLVFFKSFKKQCAFNNQTRQAKNSSILTIVTALRYLI